MKAHVAEVFQGRRSNGLNGSNGIHVNGTSI
jgi:hypothetical protein